MLDRCVVLETVWEVKAHGIVFKIDVKVLIVALVDCTWLFDSKSALLKNLLVLFCFRFGRLLFVFLFLVLFLLFLLGAGGARAATT